MAAKSLKTSGEWPKSAVWEPTGVPKAEDTLTVPTGKALKAVVTNGLGRSLALEGTAELEGSEAATATLGDGTAVATILSIPNTAAAPFAGKLTLASTSATVQAINVVPTVSFNLMLEKSGKYELAAPFKTSNLALLKVEGTATLETKSQEVSAKTVEVKTGTIANIVNSTIKCTGASGTVWQCSATATFTATGSTIEVTDTSTNEKFFQGGPQTYGAVTISGNFVLVEGSNTIPTYNVNTKRATKTVKATFTELSNHLVTTGAEESNLSPGVEVSAAEVPKGTTIIKKIEKVAEVSVWEMSANAEKTVAVAETVTIYSVGLLDKQGTTQTVTTIGCNGTTEEPARWATNEGGKAATIKLPGDLEITGVARIKDHKFEGGILYAPNAVNVSGNTNLKIEAKPGGSGVVGKGTGALLLTGTSAGIVRAVVSGKASGALVLTGTSTGIIRSLVSGKATGTLLLTGQSKGSISNNVTGSASGALILTGSGRAFKPAGTSTKRALILVFDE